MRVISVFFLLLFSSCTSLKFSKDGVMVDDVDKYINASEQINIWTYMNFYPSKGRKSGVLLDKLYPMDKEVLAVVKYKIKGSKVLFSALPSGYPKYNFIALSHKKSVVDTASYEKVKYNSASYYRKDFYWGGLDIRHVVIPYGKKKNVSLICYAEPESHQNCKFCKFDYLANINAKELQSGEKYTASWFISESSNGGLQNSKILVPSFLKSKYNRVLVHVLENYGENTGIKYFKVLNPKDEKEMDVKLFRGKYFVEFQDDKGNLLHKDSLQLN